MSRARTRPEGQPDIGAKRGRVRAGGEHHGVRLERAVRQHDSGDTAVRVGKRLHFGLLGEPCTRLYRGTDEGQGRGDRVKRSLARGVGRNRRRRGESWLEATDLVLLDQPHVVAPGGVLGDHSLRLGRILGPGESPVPVDCECAAQLAIQTTVVRDREVPKLREDGGVAVDDVDPRERACRHARSRPRSLDYRHRRARGREMVGKRRADNPGPHDDDRRTPGHRTTSPASDGPTSARTFRNAIILRCTPPAPRPAACLVGSRRAYRRTGSRAYRSRHRDPLRSDSRRHPPVASDGRAQERTLPCAGWPIAIPRANFDKIRGESVSR